MWNEKLSQIKLSQIELAHTVDKNRLLQFVSSVDFCTGKYVMISKVIPRESMDADIRV
jgi:hypothetical protein